MLHVLPRHGGVNQVAPADIHPDVGVAGEPEDVSGLQVLGGEGAGRRVQGDRRQVSHRVVADSRYRDARRRPGLHHQARAVEAGIVARTGATVVVRAADLLVGELDGLIGLGAYRAGVLAATARAATARAAAARAATRRDPSPLHRGE